MTLRKVITAVVLTNVLWGVIPIPAVATMKSYSLFTMLFFRFVYASLACIIIVAFIRWRYPSVKGIGSYIASTNRAFTRVRVYQVLYLAIVGFMIAASLSILFFSYGLVGVVISTMVSEALTPVLIAFWNWSKGTEKIDFLKAVYMVLLVLAVLIISSARVGADVAIRPIGFLYVGVSAVLWTLFIAFIAKDLPSKKEVEAVNLSSENYRVARSTLKLGMTFMFGGIMIFPLTLSLPSLSQLPDLVHQCNQFYTDLTTSFISAALDPSILILSFILTFVPYMLLYAAQAFWPKEALTFDQWSAILGLITPLIASYVGIFVIGETTRIDYTLIATAFLMTSIAMRYFHEVSNKVVGFIFMEIDVAKKRRVYSHLSAIRELQEIYAITGEACDIYAEVVTSNLNHLYLLVQQRIRTIDGIRNTTTLLVQKIMEPHRRERGR